MKVPCSIPTFGTNRDKIKTCQHNYKLSLEHGGRKVDQKSYIYDKHKVDIVPGGAGCIYFNSLTLTAYRVTKIKPEIGVK